MVRRSSAAPGTLPCCPWWTLGGGALVAVATVTLSPSLTRGGVVRGASNEGLQAPSQPAPAELPGVLGRPVHTEALRGDRDEDLEADPDTDGSSPDLGARANVGLGAE